MVIMGAISVRAFAGKKSFSLVKIQYRTYSD